MKNLSFNKNGILNEPLKYWVMNNETLVAIYQGSRGANPELDFIVKYREGKKRLRAPSHTHWIVDLIVKSEYHKQLVKEMVEYWLEQYNQMTPFQSTSERNNYELILFQNTNGRFDELNQVGDYSVEFLSAIIELFIRCEKQTPNAFMFRGLLELLIEFCEDKKDFYQVVGLSKRV
jgi:hypothetical protein